MILLMEISSLFKNIIPILETVAGLAYCKSLVSNMKLTLDPNDILSPVGSVKRWLSSSTLLRLSIHSGSISPSQIIQFNTLNYHKLILLEALLPHILLMP
jgi:hypothetical protein